MNQREWPDNPEPEIWNSAAKSSTDRLNNGVRSPAACSMFRKKCRQQPCLGSESIPNGPDVTATIQPGIGNEHLLRHPGDRAKKQTLVIFRRLLLRSYRSPARRAVELHTPLDLDTPDIGSLPVNTRCTRSMRISSSSRWRFLVAALKRDGRTHWY